MLKKILIFLIILMLFVIAGVFVVNKTAGAASNTYSALTKAAPCINDESGDNRYIRMQIGIPGVTKSCVDNGKTYHYVSANLPEYVKKFYNFAVGAIAIIAVIMIMIAGLQWIFAAGNPSTINTAKTNITSAISGLVLILFSYVLLYTINPNLVNLSLTQPKSVVGLEQGTFWCSDMQDKSEKGKDVIFFEKDHIDDLNYIFTKKKDTQCYKKYHFGYRDSKGSFVELGKNKLCYGSNCASGEICVGDTGFTYCIDPVDLCTEKTNSENCTKVNESFARTSSQTNILENSCFKRDDAWYKWMTFAGGDNCDWGKIIVCPGSTERVSCLSGTTIDKDTKTGCYDKNKKPAELKNEAVYYYCSDSPYANQNSSMICCKNGVKFELYSDKSKTDGYESAPYDVSNATTIDCSNKKICQDYSNSYDSSQEACLRNICKIKYSCKWESSSCKPR